MHHAINEYQLRLDVQCFLWPAYYIVILYYAGPVASWGVMRLDHTILADIITLERQEETVLGQE